MGRENGTVVPDPALSGYQRLRLPIGVPVLLFTCAYATLVQSAFYLTFPITNFLTFWPPSGLFVAVLLLHPARTWPLFCAGAYAATTLVDVLHERAGLVSQLYIVGNCVEAVTGAWLVQRLAGGRPTMHRLRDVAGLVIGSAFTSTALCATVGMAASSLDAGSSVTLTKWFLWWTSNMLGVLVVAPLTLCLLTKNWAPRQIRFSRFVEFVVLACCIACAAWLTSQYVPTWGHLGSVAVLLILWAALRYGPLGTAGCGAFLALSVVWLGSRGHGLFALPSSEIVWPLQAYLAVVQLTGMMLAAVFAEREAVRQALDISQTRLQDAQRIAQVGSFVRDLRSGADTWSAELYRLLGYAPDEVNGTHDLFRHHIHPDDVAEVERNIRIAMTTGKLCEFDFRYLTRGDEVRHARGVCHLALDSGRVPVALHGVVQDITDRKAMQERLLQSEKMEAIGQLAGGVAHDFNNMLTAILGNAEMLQQSLSDPETRRLAEGIVRASLRSADLAKKLLAFARKGKYLSVPLNVHAVIAEVVALLEHSVDKRIAIRQVLEARPPITLGDPAQLQNALLNLAINARDAMPEGGALTFETRVVDLDEAFCRTCPYDLAPGRYIEVGVRDTGIGMDANTMKHLFEPFFTTKKAGAGTGLGLAAVYGAVRNHHGGITVESEPGRGSTFHVFLPLAEESAPGATPLPAPSAGQGKAHVLLVDDEELIRNVGTRVLTGLGYRVTACADGAEAVEVYRNAWREIDLVLLDMVMPHMGGREAFIAMRAINPRVKALLSSGYSLNDEAQAILDAGVLGFIEKPFRTAELAANVSRSLQDNPAPAATAAQ